MPSAAKWQPFYLSSMCQGAPKYYIGLHLVLSLCYQTYVPTSAPILWFPNNGFAGLYFRIWLIEMLIILSGKNPDNVCI